MPFIGEIRFKGKRVKTVTRLGWIRSGRCVDEDEFFITVLDDRDGRSATINKHEVSEVTLLDEPEEQP